MPEAIASQLSPGAGRYRDVVWPDPGDIDQPPSNVKVGVRNSPNPLGMSTGNVIQAGAGSGTQGGVVSNKGVDCAQFFCAVATGVAVRFDGLFSIHPKTTRQAIPYTNDDEAVMRLYCNMALSGALAAGGDVSFNMVMADSMNPIVGGAATGWAIQFVDLNTVRLQCGATGPLGQQSFLIPVNDTTAWHSYEFRITNATATADAQLQVRIDGVVIAIPAMFSSWAPATTCLPGSQVRAGRTGFRPLLNCQAGNANALFISALRLMTAPTMLGVL